MSNTKKVAEFHAKHAFILGEDLRNKAFKPEDEAAGTSRLLHAADMLATMSKRFESGTAGEGHAFDARIIRAHLMMEELAEVLEGLAQRDRLKTLDGLADLSYVTHGTAVAYALPLDEAFDEVHFSNMTKAVRKADDTRLRDKGTSYVAPNLEKLLEA